MNIWTFATYLAYIYGIIVLGFASLFAFLGFTSWLRERREDMRCGRAVRLAHSYEIAPEAAPFSEEELQDLEDWGLMVDTSDDPQWIEDGIELLSLHATWAQKPGDELAA